MERSIGYDVAAIGHGCRERRGKNPRSVGRGQIGDTTKEPANDAEERSGIIVVKRMKGPQPHRAATLLEVGAKRKCPTSGARASIVTNHDEFTLGEVRLD
jgi:hypothetical protein